MKTTSKAGHLLHELAERAQHIVMCGGHHFKKTPGAFIERLPEEKRAVLRELRSDDIADFRVPDYW
jgi:hypothetical protein